MAENEAMANTLPEDPLPPPEEVLLEPAEEELVVVPDVDEFEAPVLEVVDDVLVPDEPPLVEVKGVPASAFSKQAPITVLQWAIASQSLSDAQVGAVLLHPFATRKRIRARR